MADDQAPPASGADAPNPEAGFGATMHKILRSIAIIMIMQTIFKYAGDYIKAPAKVDFAKPDAVKGAGTVQSDQTLDPTHEQDYSVTPRSIRPIWTQPAAVDVSIYLAESQTFKPQGREPFIKETNIRVGDWQDVRKVSKKLRFSQHVLNNGSLYAHVFTNLSPGSKNPDDPILPEGMAVTSSYLLTRYMPRRRDTTVKKLIGGTTEEETFVEKEVVSKEDIISFYHTTFTLALVGDAGVIPYESIHPVIRPLISLEPTNARDSSGMDAFYFPIVYENAFWQLKDHMYPINKTVTEVPFNFELSQTGMMKMQVLTSLDMAFKKQSESLAGSGGAEFEEIKRIFIETNVWLLGTTFVVSCLHSLFEFLAFKNDIMHFRSKKDNTGVSVNSILMNVIMQTIVLLYLLDNQENASWVILIGQGMGIAVEAWKITKSVNIRVIKVNSIVPYRVKFEDKHKLNETEQATKDYDADATKYLAYASAPLLVLYSIYSLVYEEHKGWWSFIVTTLVSFVYFWGFLTMVPSLWINYKLKSVAHMSTRALGYKFLNTIVDDFFAFIIKQPVLARIAAFRDDVVFIIFIYQAFIYKVDKTRVNEFGQVDDAPATVEKTETIETKKKK